MSHLAVVLSEEDGEPRQEHPAVHLALPLAQEEARAGAEDRPGQVVQDQQEDQQVQLARSPVRSGWSLRQLRHTPRWDTSGMFPKLEMTQMMSQKIE